MSWEKAVIGTALNDPRSMAEADNLVPSDFQGANQIIWAEMMILSQEDALDPRALIERVRTSPDNARVISDVGSVEEYIRDVMTYGGASMRVYADSVIHDSTRRAMRRNAALIAAAADDENRPIEDLLDYAERQILTLRRNRADTGVTMYDLYAQFMPRLDGMIAGTFQPAWKPQIVALTNVIKYAEPSDTILIAARPGDGKSSYIRYEALEEAKNKGKKWLIFNLDNDQNDYAMNFLALYTNIGTHLIRDPRRMTREQIATVKEAVAQLQKLPIRIVNAAGWSARQIVALERKLIAEEGFDRVAVDYIQLINNGLNGRNDDVSASSSQLRNVCLQLRVPHLIAAQLNREVERRGEYRPQLSDLRDSGTLEQDATKVLFPIPIWQDVPGPQQIARFHDNLGPDGRPMPIPVAVPIRIDVAKNRNGAAGMTMPILWNKATGKYSTLAREDVQNEQ